MWLLAEKAYYLIEKKKMSSVSKMDLRHEIEKASTQNNFNLYSFVENFKDIQK